MTPRKPLPSTNCRGRVSLYVLFSGGRRCSAPENLGKYSATRGDLGLRLGLHNFAIPSPVYRITLNVPLSGTIRLLTQTPMFTFTKQRGHGPKSQWTELNWVNMVCCGCDSIFFLCVFKKKNPLLYPAFLVSVS